MKASNELKRPTAREVVFALALLSTSGLAIIAHSFGYAALRFTASLVVLPSAVVIVGIILLGQSRLARFHQFARRCMVGAG